MWPNLLCLILFIGCTPSQQTKPLRSAWPSLDWQEYVYSKVANMPHAKDGKEFCPNGLTQRNFVHLFAAIAKHESNYNPKLTYREAFKNSKGEFVISTGLHQVSYESSRGYGFAGITTEDLKDPKKNIDVAVAIIRKLVGQDGVVANHTGTNWKGGARYFSTLRITGKLQSVKDYMKGWCE
jgi:hypothetical protein